ncbi:hypothetical protein DACRYDRAFT_104552 [Dacryopinax primogenitus]|uniref:Coiled-coil domain-containing protein 16 n=1 Tax=Dacryopinax primogenitus (strain DJM 731) TaxID=1858805 RepID=M5G379_DACPD|nr:uncharacterized protein DACRYDRAFT_104552 [Dacryopinax primogenitus]EJU04676.1 hypothetical protein DACRYDRAFT_104552 [Dacryopinax primogenitus]
MTDVRSLLRSHQQSTTRITHPLASYNAAGALRCLACGTPVQPRAWEGHVVSKSHRKRAATLKAEEGRKGKRKHEEEEEVREDKRPRLMPEEEAEDVEMKDAQASPPTAAFPAGFFSDPSRAPPPRDHTPDGEPPPPPSTASLPDIPLPAAAPSALDAEFDLFLQDVLAPSAPPPPEEQMFARATVFAEPELATPERPEGFPPSAAVASHPAEPIPAERARPRTDVQTASGEAPRAEETESEKRERKEREERELIMDRLKEEERAQEEADGRVERLRAKLEGMRKLRREKMGR